jgi:protoheme IX farnesyltransferase
MIGWCAATGDISLASVALFAIIFMWTPPHFWALALYRSGDYQRAGVPMLPVVAGARETKRQILLYSLLLAPVTLAPYALGAAGHAYLAAAIVLDALFVYRAVRIWFDATERSARQMFGFSILYLFLLFLALIGDKLVAGAGA